MEVTGGSDKEFHDFKGHREAAGSKPANMKPRSHQILSSNSSLRYDYLVHFEE